MRELIRKPLPQRDYRRWHLPPEYPQYAKVHVCRALGKEADVDRFMVRTHAIWIPARCDVHPFRLVSECIWSRRMGPGYPGEDPDVMALPYWWHLVKVNNWWRQRRVERFTQKVNSGREEN